MKKSILFFTLCMMASQLASAQKDAIGRFFGEYANDERFTSVYVSPKMFKLIAQIETNDPEWNSFRDVVADLGGLQILTGENLTDGLDLYKKALSKVPTSEFEELLTVRDGQENVRIWIKDSGNVIEELLLLVGEPSEFTLLSFTGKINLSKISEISKKLDIDGAEHLGKIKSDPDKKVETKQEENKN